MEFPRYESYKDSGFDWLGEVPAHWEMRKVKHIFKLIAEPAPVNNDYELLSIYTDIGVKPRKELEERGNRASTTDNYWIVRKGDFIVNKLLAWMGAVGLSEYEGVTSPAYDILRSRLPISGRFYHYLFRTKQFTSEMKRHSRGIMEMRLRLYFDKFGLIPVPYPEPEEQERIARFLDEKTAVIDSAIAKKERLIRLLEEQKQILVQTAVTRGLNPNAPTRPSGIDWIGDIPAHWEVKRLKFLGKIKYGLGQPPKEKADGLPLIRATNVERGRIVAKNLIKVDPLDIPYERDPVLRCDDIIVVRSGAYTADSAIIPQEYEGSIAGYDMVVRATKISPKYLSYCLLATYVLYNQLYLLRMRAAQPHLNAEELGETLILIPPKEEQYQIINHLKNYMVEQRKIMSRIQNEIQLLTVFKSTLIAEAVTGKIKI